VHTPGGRALASRGVPHQCEFTLIG
jgi:hypothetical protein